MQRSLKRGHRGKELASAQNETGEVAFRGEIDGGVTTDNLASIVRAGCEWLVAGVTVFRAPDPAARVAEMKRIGAAGKLVLLPTLGGQTALNTAMALHRSGALDKYDLEIQIGLGLARR